MFLNASTGSLDYLHDPREISSEVLSYNDASLGLDVCGGALPFHPAEMSTILSHALPTTTDNGPDSHRGDADDESLCCAELRPVIEQLD